MQALPEFPIYMPSSRVQYSVPGHLLIPQTIPLKRQWFEFSLAAPDPRLNLDPACMGTYNPVIDSAFSSPTITVPQAGPVDFFRQAPP